MAISVFDRPIPGQSLTDTPKNYPWERPPEMSDPDQTLRYYINKLENPDTLDNALQLLEESDMTLTGLVKGVMRTGVSQGLHSIDVGLIVAPAVHAYIKGVADIIGVDYDEGLPKTGMDSEKERKLASLKAVDMLADIGVELPTSSDVASMDTEEGMEDMPTEEEEDIQVEVEDDMMAEEEPMGLMARRSV